MTDRCTDNQHNAEQYLSRFQRAPLGHLIEGKAVSYTHLTLPTKA